MNSNPLWLRVKLEAAGMFYVEERGFGGLAWLHAKRVSFCPSVVASSETRRAYLPTYLPTINHIDTSYIRLGLAATRIFQELVGGA